MSPRVYKYLGVLYVCMYVCQYLCMYAKVCLCTDAGEMSPCACTHICGYDVCVYLYVEIYVYNHTGGMSTCTHCIDNMCVYICISKYACVTAQAR